MITSEAARLRAIRERLNLTQDKFSEELGIKQGSYSAIERGITGVSSEVLKALIFKFKVNAHWLMTGRGDIFDTDFYNTTLSNKSQDNGQYGAEVVEKLQRENSELKSELLKAKDEIIALLKQNGGKLEGDLITALGSEEEKLIEELMSENFLELAN